MDIVVFLFKKDLRLEDNFGLFKALNSGLPVYPLFIFDEKNEYSSIQKETTHFFLNQLKNKLEIIGSSLDIQLGDPLKIFLHLIRKFNIKGVYSNTEYNPFSQEREREFKNLFDFHQIPFYSFKDLVIFEKNEILDVNDSPIKNLDAFSKKWKEKIYFEKIKTYDSLRKTNNFLKQEPKFFSFSFKERNIFKKEDVLLCYGAISIRNIINKTFDDSNLYKIDFLILRDYMYYIGYHFPERINNSFKDKYEKINYSTDKSKLTLFESGKTGFPLVDACIRELIETNYIDYDKQTILVHFLTKSLLFSWKIGVLFFKKYLINYDQILTSFFFQKNVGCWVDSEPYFKVINPAIELKKIDPKLIFIKKWVPEFLDKDYNQMIDFEKSKISFLNAYKSIIINK